MEKRIPENSGSFDENNLLKGGKEQAFLRDDPVSYTHLADAALECVGTEAAVEQALGVLHNGGRMGFVGVPHYNNRALGSTFAQNISVAGGAASVTTYDKQVLLKAVLDGDINPGRVFTSSYKLEDIDQAYKDMDERKTIKAMIVLD